MRFGIFFVLALFSIITPNIFGKVLVSSCETKLWDQKVATIQTKCEMVANRILTEGYNFNELNATLDSEVEQLASLLEGRIMVVDKNFRICKDTYEMEENRYLMTADVLRVMGGEATSPHKLQEQYAEMFYPVMDSNKESITGVICVIASCQDINATVAYMEEKRETATLLTVIILLAISYVISFFFTRRYKQFNKSVHHIADGHTDERLEEIGYTEMRETARAVNEILDRTQMLEDSRQEFVSNVSHELKTPITSIKVLAESLLMQPEAEAALYREFLSDIVEEIDRENTIINDLLSLVKVDKKVAKMNIEKVNINELIDSIIKRLKPIAAKREIEIGFEPFRPVSADIDPVKLTLAMSNLIENAIKYNKDNGWVHVYLNADHKYFYFKVEDSGEGISEEHQEQIFERFYRVDKARSRETGGTGLGLAITREVTLLHKGAIKVHSVPGEGTTFTMRIPLTYVS